MKKIMLDALNEQVNAELYSSYIYLAMSAHCADQNLNGMAHWLRLQAQEEVNHAMKIFDFIIDRGGRVSLANIKAPKSKWTSILDVFKDAYKHECLVTRLIHDLIKKARKNDDVATEIFLQWFVTEQVEEEASTQEVVEKIKLAHSLLIVDAWLGKRSSSH